MAGNYITIGSKFKPFSYQEMLAPLAASTEAHQQVEQQYADLSTQASQWEGKLNPTLDQETYSKYKSYSDELNAKADMLAREGLNQGSRRSMLSMRDKYAKEILPIEIAYAKRAEDDKVQRQLELADPSRRFSRKASQTSLNKYIDNPNLEFSSVSLEQLKGQVAQLASMRSKGLNSFGKDKPVDNFTNTFKKQHGHTKEEVQDAIDNPNKEGSSAILNDIVDTVMEGSNIYSWADQKTLDEARRYLSQGLFAAVGQTDVQIIENKEAFMAAQEAMQIRSENRKADNERQQRINAYRNRKIPINTVNIVSPDKEGSVAQRRAKSASILLGLQEYGSNTLQDLPKDHIFGPSTFTGVYTSGGGPLTKMTPVVNKEGKPHFKLWDGEKMLTKQQFSQQGISEGDREKLASHYDSVIKRELKFLGYDLDKLNKAGKTVTKGEVNEARKSIQDETGPYSIGTIEFRVSDPSKTFEKMLPLLSSGDETFIKEIESFDKEGNIKTNTKIVKLKDFYKGDELISTPVFMGSINKNSQNIIMKFNGKTYDIPREKLGSMSDETYTYDVPRLNDAMAKRREYIDKYGPELYNASKAAEDLESIIESSGGAYYKSMMNVLTAFSPDASYKLNE